MKKLNIFIALISIVFTLSCKDKKDPKCFDGSHNGITFKNNSNQTVNFEIYWNYPDTIIGDYNPVSDKGTASNSDFTRGAGPFSCWESVLGQNKEWIYIFSQDSLKTIPWETIRKTNRGLLERRAIDVQYLEKNN